MSYDCFLNDSGLETDLKSARRRISTLESAIDSQRSAIVDQLYAALLLLAQSKEKSEFAALKIFEKLENLSGNGDCESENTQMMRAAIAGRKDWSALWCYPSHVNAARIKRIAESDVLLNIIILKNEPSKTGP